MGTFITRVEFLFVQCTNRTHLCVNSLEISPKGKDILLIIFCNFLFKSVCSLSSLGYSPSRACFIKEESKKFLNYLIENLLLSYF